MDLTGGLSWGELIESLVASHGTLTAVAWKLIDRAEGDDVASVERALRRLRTRGQRDGGRWGQHLIRVFGVPQPIEQRLRWLGLYHSPFNDLPVELCLDQLRLWDRPPVSTSRARVWLHLGFASCALRRRDHDDATTHTRRARSALAALGPDYDTARIELSFIEAYLASRRADGEGDHDAALAEAASRLGTATVPEDDRACFEARLADHRGYRQNHAHDFAAGLATYDTIPTGAHPFASYRREAGRAYALFRLGRTDEALAAARIAIDHAGDGGYTRLRAMGLLILARIRGDRGDDERARALAIADRLGDIELRLRATKR